VGLEHVHGGALPVLAPQVGKDVREETSRQLDRFAGVAVASLLFEIVGFGDVCVVHGCLVEVVRHSSS